MAIYIYNIIYNYAVRQAVGATLIIDKEDEEDEKLINGDILQAR